ncbi:hypothetical protein ACFL6C_01340 [Myxococcota bacterium]
MRFTHIIPIFLIPTSCLAATALAEPSQAPTQAGQASTGQASTQEGQADVMGALPGDIQVGYQLEAALVYHDLRAHQRMLEAKRAILGETHVGAAFYADGVQEKAFGFDPLGELARILDLAVPDSGPVPAAVAGFTGPTGLGVQLLMYVEEGFLDRLAGALGSANPPPWTAQIVDDTIRIELEDITLLGKVEDGWLRMAPSEAMLVGGAGGNQFEGTMRKWTDDCDGLLFMRGGGMFSSMLAGEVGGIAGQFIQSMRAAGIGWKWDGNKTVVTRILVDIPQLEEIRTAARPSDLVNSLAEVWDEDTTGFASLSLPPAVVATILPLVEREMQGSDVELPDAIMHALTQLDGRLGFVVFDSPGDWAAGIGFRDAKTAKNVVPALQKWLVSLSKALDTSMANTYTMETFPGAGEIMHMRPDVGLEGWRAAAVGKTLVVVANKSRLKALVDRQQLKAKGDTNVSALAGPLTRIVRETLDKPAMVLGYLILTSEGGMFEYLSWSSSGLQDLWKKEMAEFPQLQFVGRFLNRLPTYMTLEGIYWTLMYDAALWVDLDNSVLVIQILNSEI